MDTLEVNDVGLLELEVKLLSGDALATFTVSSACILGKLHAMLQIHLQPGFCIQELFYGVLVLENVQQTLVEAGLPAEGCVRLTVVVGEYPTLHLFEACSGVELAERCGGWIVGGAAATTCVADSVQHCSMSQAPCVAKHLAETLKDVCGPSLAKNQVVQSSEGSDGGEVVVIAGPGDDPKQACIKALAILDHIKNCHIESLWGEATLEEKHFSDCLENGESFHAYECDSFLRATRVMVDHLSRHFEFNFSEKFVVAPVIYGGYASDGCIVGILSSRVWT